MKKTIWTDDSIAYLKENYPYTTDTAIAQHLCVNRKTVSLKAKELGLEKVSDPNGLIWRKGYANSTALTQMLKSLP